MFSTVNIPRSITNPNVIRNDAIDINSPMSFLTFIKIVDKSLDAEINQVLYTKYLSSWNVLNSGNDDDLKNFIIERYREFIQDINLDYTTLEEKKFLKSIDFKNPSDLDIVIPFYSRKLIEICDYYNQQREETKFQVLKNQTKGTSDFVKKELKDIILNYFEYAQESKIFFDIEKIKETLSIDIEELYDTYPEYFNQTPEELIYDYKDLDYGLDVFLKNDLDLIEEVFGGVSEEIKDLKEVDSLFDNKRKLTQKYLGTNFYYISTGNTTTDFISGLAAIADDPALNFLNINHPTTASTEDRKILIDEYEMGFFKPSKTSIILIDGDIKAFNFNFEKLKPNTIYYFPDPTIRGENGGILSFINNDHSFKKNFSSGKMKNLPNDNKLDTKYYGYKSQIEIGDNKYLDQIFEKGFIQDAKNDIWNNLFGLFKIDDTFVKNLELREIGDDQNYIILNGHTFYDLKYDEGFSFDYSIYDDSTIPNTTRSGLSTNTGGFSAFRNINLFGGRFTDDFKYPDNFFENQQILDGIFISNGDEALIDSISSDLSAYPLSGDFYYSRLIEAGIHDASIPQRALLDPLFPSISADLTQTIIPDNINTFIIDGGFVTTIFNTPIYLNSEIYYDDTVFNNSEFVNLSSDNKNLYERFNIQGQIFVKNSITKTVQKLGDALPHLINVLPLSTYSKVISGITNFELINDTLFLETDSNISIIKLLFDGGEFIDPKIQTHSINFNKNPFNKISKRFKIEDDVYFAIFDVVEHPPNNTLKIIPELYILNLKDHELRKEIHNPTYFEIDNVGKEYNKMESPTSSFSPRKNVMNNSFLLKNPSNFFNLVEVDYTINPFKIIKISQFLQK